MFVPLTFAPSEAFQFDWSEDHARIAGERVKLQIAQFQPSYSHAFVLRAYAVVLCQSLAPLRVLTQGAGAAWRMKTAPFRRRLEDAPALRRLLHRYVDVLMRQLAQTAACTRFHVVEERLARWLLMTQDRAHADSFDVTQEFLAFMLGVRRVGVTTAAGVLQSRKLIHYTRGNMTILDRDRLETAACACYRSDLEIYRHGLKIVRNL